MRTLQRVRRSETCTYQLLYVQLDRIRQLLHVRSPLPGASIFHTDHLSQPCPVSFLFLEAPPTGILAGV